MNLFRVIFKFTSLYVFSLQVFNYDGQYSRQIGGDSITKCPFGLCFTSLGHIIIGRKSKELVNVTIFAQDGELVSKQKSKEKHVLFFDMATMDDGSVVFSSYDNCLYVYRCA